MENPSNVFISYAQQDILFWSELEAHLAPLVRDGIVRTWHIGALQPGTERSTRVAHELDAAHIVLALISADLLASDWCYEMELAPALERARRGKVQVVPVVLRACTWNPGLLSGLQQLPRSGRAIANYSNRDDAWAEVIMELLTLLGQPARQLPTAYQPRTSKASEQPPILAMAPRFDFALSFAGADRSTARAIYKALVADGFKAFLDEEFEHEMLGVDGIQYLTDIYSRQSRHCIVLISREYDARRWTQLERESIQARELTGERGVLIPVKLSDHSPQWLPPSRIYFDLSLRPISDLMKILRAKHRSAVETSPDSIAPPSTRPVDLTGTWASEENIGRMASRRGLMKLRQDGRHISGSAALVEQHPNGDSIEFELELHGETVAPTGAIRFIGALVRVIKGHSYWPYSVDSFAGRIVDTDRIEGVCEDDRGVRGDFRLHRSVST